MERQTLQQQAPVYHVCQECGGDGCEACSYLCILDGDIELDPYECRYCGWIGGHVDGCVSVDPNIDQPTQVERFTSAANLFTRMPYRSVYAEWNHDYLMDCGIGGEK